MGQLGGVDTATIKEDFQLYHENENGNKKPSSDNPRKGGNTQSSRRASEHSLSASQVERPPHPLGEENKANNPGSDNNWLSVLQKLPAASRKALTEAWKNMPEDPTGILKQLEARWAEVDRDTAKKAALLAAASIGTYFAGHRILATSYLESSHNTQLPDLLAITPFRDSSGAIERAWQSVVNAVLQIATSPVGLTVELIRALVITVVRSVQTVADLTGWSLNHVLDSMISALSAMGVGNEIIAILNAIRNSVINNRFDDIDRILDWVLNEIGFVPDGYSSFSTGESLLRSSDTANVIANTSESFLEGAPKTLMAIALTAAAKSIDVKNALDSIKLPDGVKEPLNQICELFDTYNIPKTLVLNTLYYTVMLSNPASGLAKAIAIEATAQLARKGPAQLSKETFEIIASIKEQAEKIVRNPGDAADYTLRTLAGLSKTLTNSVNVH